MRIFPPQINIPARRPHRGTRNRHALHQAERVTLHNHAVRKRTGITLIGVTDNIFLVRNGRPNRLPLNPCRKPRPAAPAQPGIFHLRANAGTSQRQSALHPNIAAMGAVIVQIQRVDHPATRKRQPLLPRKKRNFFNQPQCLAMRLQVAKQPRHIRHTHRPKPNPALRRCHLHQWLQPEHTARASPHQLNFNPARPRFRHNRGGNLISANRQRRGIARQENLHHATAIARFSSAAASSRPCTSSSSIALGAQAHRPRQ